MYSTEVSVGALTRIGLSFTCSMNDTGRPVGHSMRRSSPSTRCSPCLTARYIVFVSGSAPGTTRIGCCDGVAACVTSSVTTHTTIMPASCRLAAMLLLCLALLAAPPLAVAQDAPLTMMTYQMVLLKKGPAA